jgi:hypothetical protein
MALHSTSGQNGYATQNICKVLEGKNDTNKDTVTTITQTAATTTTKGTIPHVGPAVNADITPAINQLAANQTAIMLQMVAILFAQAPAQHTLQYVLHDTFQVPPIQQVVIPMQQHFPVGDFNTGRGGRQGGQGCGRGRGGWGCNPFADYMQTTVAVQTMPGQLIPHGGGMAQIPPPPGVQQQNCNQDFSNVYKRCHNWNVCFLCGFNIENGHTSTTCSFRKMNHQQAYTRKNAQQFIAVGYDPCTKGMHKTILPLARNNWWCGAESMFLANKCNNLVSASATSLDPILSSTSSSLLANDK